MYVCHQLVEDGFFWASPPDFINCKLHLHGVAIVVVLCPCALCHMYSNINPQYEPASLSSKEVHLQ